MDRTFQGKITIGRYSSNGSRNNQCYITITDELSGVEFLKIEVSAESLGLALTGLSAQECSFDHYPTHVGKVREIKHEIVQLPTDFKWQERRQVVMEAASEFEVDGWYHQITDTTRIENVAGRGEPEAVKVAFIRFIGGA